MRAVIYNHVKSKMDGSADSLCLRLGILIADEICYAGHGYGLLQFQQFFIPKTIQQKLELMSQYDEALGYQLDFDINDAIKLIKGYNKLKNKTKEVIVSYNILIRNIDKSFEDMKAQIETAMQRWGIIQLAGIFPRDYFTMVYQDNDKGEAEDDARFTKAMSRILTLQTTYHEEDKTINNNIPPVFFLQPDFMNDAFRYTRAQNTEQVNHKASFKYKKVILRIPNFISATFIELETVRQQIAHEAKLFNAAVDEWLGIIYSGEKNSEELFNQKLIPAANILQKKIDSNELINSFRKAINFTSDFEIVAGETPLPEIWNFFDAYGSVFPDTLEQLKKLKKENNKYSRPYPFFSIDALTSLDKKYYIDEKTEINPVKKNLSLD